MASNTARLIVCLMAMAAFLQVTSATEYEVGGSFGWNFPPNTTFYSEWASSKNFFVGDELVFKSNGSVSDFFGEPSTQSEYENCTDPGIVIGVPVSGVTRTLQRSGAYYFISTVDNHCENGQKFAINVSTLPGTTSPPSPPPPPSSSPSLSPPPPSSASSPSPPPPPSSAPSLSYGSASALLVAAAAMIFY